MRNFLNLGHREQLNQVTAFVDGSSTYGSDVCEMRKLRAFVGGRLNSTRHPIRGKDLLPLTGEHLECKSPSGVCFTGGSLLLFSFHFIQFTLHMFIYRRHSCQRTTWIDFHSHNLYERTQSYCYRTRQNQSSLERRTIVPERSTHYERRIPARIVQRIPSACARMECHPTLRTQSSYRGLLQWYEFFFKSTIFETIN